MQRNRFAGHSRYGNQIYEPHRVNGAYISPSLRRRALVRRTERLGRSVNRCRGTLRRGY